MRRSYYSARWDYFDISKRDALLNQISDGWMLVLFICILFVVFRDRKHMYFLFECDLKVRSYIVCPGFMGCDVSN